MRIVEFGTASTGEVFVMPPDHGSAVASKFGDSYTIFGSTVGTSPLPSHTPGSSTVEIDVSCPNDGP